MTMALGAPQEITKNEAEQLLSGIQVLNERMENIHGRLNTFLGRLLGRNPTTEPTEEIKEKPELRFGGFAGDMEEALRHGTGVVDRIQDNLRTLERF